MSLRNDGKMVDKGRKVAENGRPLGNGIKMAVKYQTICLHGAIKQKKCTKY